MNTFFQFCVGACVFLVFFTGAITFVNALGVFPMDVEIGETYSFDMNAVWIIVLSVEAIGALALAILTQNTSLIGVYIFSIIFWDCYINTWSILSNLGSFDVGALPILIGLIHLGVLFLFVGAVIGMLSGSG